MSIDAHPPLVDMEELGKWHQCNRVRNCRSDREAWPCRTWRDAETMNALHAALLTAQGENEKLTAHLATVERERDEWGGKASTAAAEALAFRAQRDAAASVNHRFRERAERAEEAIESVRRQRDALRDGVEAMVETRLDDARAEIQAAHDLIGELADLVRDDIVEDDVALEALVYDAIKRVISEREDARRWAVRLEGMRGAA